MLIINAGQCAVYADKFDIQTERYDGEYMVQYIFDNISVWDNGRKLTNYGTEYHGLRIMVDIRPMVAEWLDSYVNGAKGMEFSSPCEEIVRFKQEFFEDSGVVWEGGHIPEWYCYAQNEEALRLQAVSKKGCCYYAGDEGFVIVKDAKLVLVDNEDEPVAGSLTADYYRKNLVYMRPDAKRFLF